MRGELWNFISRDEVLRGWFHRCCTCPQTAWCRAAWEQPDQGSGGWTWRERSQRGQASPHHIPPAPLRSPDTYKTLKRCQVRHKDVLSPRSYWMIHSPVRHGGGLLVDELLRCRHKHAHCARRWEETCLCRTCQRQQKAFSFKSLLLDNGWFIHLGLSCVFNLEWMSDPSPRCRCYVVHWTDAPAVSSSADSSSEPPESLASPDGTELRVKHTTKHQGWRFCWTAFSFLHAFKTDRDEIKEGIVTQGQNESCLFLVVSWHSQYFVF